MNLSSIADTILDEASSPGVLRATLEIFVKGCGELTGIRPDPCFDAWAGDSHLESGVAINPQAAANCAIDYRRSVVFIRGVYAAICKLRRQYPDCPLEILYAGCGPFATLLMPLLGKFSPGDLDIYLLDIHQHSLDSVVCLLDHCGLKGHAVSTVRDDACQYRHPGKLHLIIAETMQKALEQEPQWAVTANLASQLRPEGIFIPQRVEVTLGLADLDYEREKLLQRPQLVPAVTEFDALRHSLATVCILSPENAADQMHGAGRNPDTGGLELHVSTVMIPALADNSGLEAALFTRIVVLDNYCLNDYESEITLPLRCRELAPLTVGACYRVSYHFGSYPRFDFEYFSE